MKRFGGEYVEIRKEGANFEESVHSAVLYAKEHKMVYLHPFADPDIIIGYATMAVEIIEEIPNNVDVLLVPTGGGGLITGVSSYFKSVSPSTMVVGVEP